ncbi:MAG: hypothetical protein GY926_11565 [bacterium]|nr:hypothetical protein [bacterium]
MTADSLLTEADQIDRRTPTGFGWLTREDCCYNCRHFTPGGPLGARIGRCNDQTPIDLVFMEMTCRNHDRIYHVRDRDILSSSEWANTKDTETYDRENGDSDGG